MFVPYRITELSSSVPSPSGIDFSFSARYAIVDTW